MVTKINEFRKIFENADYFGHDEKYLLSLYRIDDEEVDETEEQIKQHLVDSVKKLQKIQKQKKIKLYRVIFVKDVEDIDKNKLGLHYVSDVGDFHDGMIAYLYMNAHKLDRTLKYNDLYLIEVEAPTKDINYKETLRYNMMHPWESEIMLLSDKNVKVKKIETYYR